MFSVAERFAYLLSSYIHLVWAMAVHKVNAPGAAILLRLSYSFLLAATFG